MMIENIIDNIGEIFVGRHSELQRLHNLWRLAKKEQEHMVYVFLNAPGVGKTTLVNHFGKIIEEQRKGIYIKISRSTDYDSSANLNKDLVFLIQNIIQNKQEFINNYINSIENEHKKQAFRNKMQLINDLLNKIFTQDLISSNDIIFILKRISEIIPIFLVADEIQEFQKISFVHDINNSHEEETALHYFTRFLKSLLNSRILLVLSGTRYHILSKIGTKIGSPIRHKVKLLVIQQFNQEDMNEYITRVRELIGKADIGIKSEILSAFLENYREFVFAFSGGHPRMVATITDRFLMSLSTLASDLKYLNYQNFMSYLLSLTETTLKTTLLSSEEQKILIDLSSSTRFSTVKEWILKGAYNGLFLGKVPELSNKPKANEEIDDLAYNLMNFGTIVQNSNYNYHVTSYFHLLAFIKPFTEPHEVFLNQVLHNKCFELMCGDHAGFGFTFENILSATLMMSEIRPSESGNIPIKTALLKNLIVLHGAIKWNEISIDQNVLYQTPAAEAIDAMILQEEILLLIQITTANPPDHSKIDSLLHQMKIISEILPKNEKLKKKIKGWLVSLFDFQKRIPDYENLLITSGDKLIPILGKELYIKLKEVKISF